MLRRLWKRFVPWLLKDIDAGRAGGKRTDTGCETREGSRYDAGGDAGISLQTLVRIASLEHGYHQHCARERS